MENKLLQNTARVITIIVLVCVQNAAEPISTYSLPLFQKPSPNFRELEALIRRAEAHVKAGSDSLKKGERASAKREFNEAIDVILNSGFDAQRSSQLQSYYVTLVDRLSKLESIPKEQWSEPFYDDKGAPFFSDVEREVTAEEAQSAIQTFEKMGLAGTGSPLVVQYVHFYALRGHASMAVGLQRGLVYEGMFRRIFQEEGIPPELSWMAYALTDWNVYAKSRSNAAGLWQIPSAVAQRYGLAQTPWLDERFNPEKATRAAARSLKQLIRRYNGDWGLAISGYISGDLDTDRAIARAGVAALWHIWPYLTVENRSLIVQTLASIYIGYNKEMYGFVLDRSAVNSYEIVNVAPATDLGMIAKVGALDLNALRNLNAELRTQFTPPTDNYQLRVPDGKAAALLKLRVVLKTSTASSNGPGLGNRIIGLSVSEGKVISPSTQPKCTLTPGRDLKLAEFHLGDSPRVVLSKVEKEFGLDANAREQIIKNLETLDPQSVGRLTVSMLTKKLADNTGDLAVNVPGIPSIFVSPDRWPTSSQKFDQYVIVFRSGSVVSVIVQFNTDARWQDVDDLTLGISEDLRLSGQWELGEEGCIVRTLPCVGLTLSTSFELDRTNGEYRARVMITDTGTAKK